MVIKAKHMAGGNVAEANRAMVLAQSCQGATDLLFTVSETAAVMYRDYLISSQRLQDQMFEIAQRCAGVLKKNSPMMQ